MRWFDAYGTSILLWNALHGGRSENPFDAARVALVARVLVHQLAALPQRKLRRPRTRPRRRIVGGEAVVDRVGVDAREALDEVQMFARASEFDLLRKVDRVDDERGAFPVSARIAHPPRHGAMRAAVHRHDARVV